LDPRRTIIGTNCLAGKIAVKASNFAADVRMDPRVRELALLTMLACLCLGVAWAQDEELFGAVFAAEAARAAIEAVYLSL
jgi:hypothetical protein